MNGRKILKYRILSMLTVVVAFLIGACAHGPAPKQMADVIYTGGDIITMNDSQPTAGAIAIKDGKILMVGNKADIKKHKGNSTKIVNLNGKTLLPGFIDAHGHVFNAGLQALAANLLAIPDGTVNDITSLQQTLRDWAEKYPSRVNKTGWIIGFGHPITQRLINSTSGSVAQN